MTGLGSLRRALGFCGAMDYFRLLSVCILLVELYMFEFLPAILEWFWGCFGKVLYLFVWRCLGNFPFGSCRVVFDCFLWEAFCW